MKVFRIVPILLLVGLFAAGCQQQAAQTDPANNKPTIYTTLYPIQYAAEQIAGDTMNIETVYPPGIDAHTYEPTSKDMTTIAEGDAFIYLGAGMEAFAQTAADALSNQEVQLAELGTNEELFQASQSGSEHQHNSNTGHDHGGIDPHIWLDPLRMIQMAELIKDELINVNPSEEVLYNENFNTLKENLLALDQQFKNVLGDKENKQLLVNHAAYGYWEERYGIEQIAINGLTSDSEPSQQELTEIIDMANANDLNYVIYEQNTSNSVAEVIQNEIGAEPLTIHNLAVLTEENINNDEDYISLMMRNLEVLDQATN